MGICFHEYVKTGSCAHPDTPTLDQHHVELSVGLQLQLVNTGCWKRGIQDAQCFLICALAQPQRAEGKCRKAWPACGDWEAPSDHFTHQEALDKVAPGQRLWESNSPRLAQPPHSQRRSLSRSWNPCIAPWQKLWHGRWHGRFIHSIY